MEQRMERGRFESQLLPKEWDAKLDLFMKISKWTQKNLSDYSGIPTGTISGGRKESLILPRHYDSLAGTMRVTEADLLGSFELFEKALLNSWCPSWNRLISELLPLPLSGCHFVVKRAPDHSRLVQVTAEDSGADILKIKIGHRYHISIDVMYILEASSIQLSDDSNPISPYQLYLFQVEGEECLMLRPNVHLNPDGLADLIDEYSNSEPRWRMHVPPHTAKSDGMTFGGEPCAGDFFVLLRRRPISEKLQSDLSNPRGAKLSFLDELARELRSDSGTTPDLRNYWRMFRKSYQLVR